MQGRTGFHVFLDLGDNPAEILVLLLFGSKPRPWMSGSSASIRTESCRLKKASSFSFTFSLLRKGIAGMALFGFYADDCNLVSLQCSGQVFYRLSHPFPADHVAVAIFPVQT